jgi:3-deoxy-D-manno-octulosonic-acid transferase
LNDATGETEVVLVDRVGVLGDLYALADVAFVGGGFHDAGLHSVLEPAAFGVPVLFGPRHTMSRDAGVLIRHAGARSTGDLSTLAAALSEWSMDGVARATAGEHALATVRDGVGAAARSLAVVESLLGLPNDAPR